MDANALRGAIVSKGMTQKQVAEHLGIAPKTFTAKMKRGAFGTDEAAKMIALPGTSEYGWDVIMRKAVENAKKWGVRMP